MHFIGVDLAWSPRNDTGLAALQLSDDALRLIECALGRTDEEILSFITRHTREGSTLVAIDAPLDVPNETGRRRAEAEIGAAFRRYHAGAHPANRQRLSAWSGTIRGEDLAEALQEHGYSHEPLGKERVPRQSFVEVYPHPAMVVLFGLDRILQYKNRPKRSTEDRWHAFEQYQQHLRALRNPPVDLPEAILSTDVRVLRGSRLKAYEDVLDAIFCAYIAAYSWMHPDKCRIYGNREEGYIMSPRPE